MLMFVRFLIMAVLTATPGFLLAQEAEVKEKSTFSDLFIDPEDGALDASAFLQRGGFIPVPLVITEPAVGYGVGFGLLFLGRPGEDSLKFPTRTFLGVIKTQNGTEVGFLGRSGSIYDGLAKYRIYGGGGSVNLDFFPGGTTTGLSFNNKAFATGGDIQFNVAKNFFIGPSFRTLDNDVTPNLSGGTPLPPGLTQTIKLRALGVSAHFDTRDNSLTPTSGTNLNFALDRFDTALGSDQSYTGVSLFGAHFWSPDDLWTFAGKARFQGTYGDTPFFMEPSISLRGVPYNRFQGNRVLSTEIEIRRWISSRWAVLGFAGYGYADATGASAIGGTEDTHSYGVGVRYRAARLFGLDVGLDVARGPEGTVFHVQFGHAWSLEMN